MSEGPSLKAGWRWESFGNVELQVPDSWAYGTTHSPWCIADGPGKPYVGRPGFNPDILCSAKEEESGADSAFTVKSGGTFVWFRFGTIDNLDPAGRLGTSGDRVTTIKGEVEIAIQAPRDVLSQIVSTVGLINKDDAHGCPVTHAISTNAAWRPPAATLAAQTAAVTGVSACRYVLWDLAGRGGHQVRPAPSLISSLELTGADAEAAVRGTATAPGGGPNQPTSCLEETSYGNEVIVLRIRHGGDTEQPQEIVLRYAGCDHHGFDDGSQVTRLTKVAVTPFLAGPNQVVTWRRELKGIIPESLTYRPRGR